jgi:outer membrane lipoprotein-sorting protein
MKTLKQAFLLSAGLISMNLVHAQTADEIIQKSIDACGGKDKINSIKTIYKESSLEVMGNEAPATTYIVNGKAYKFETDFGGQKIVQCFTENGGWGFNPMQGQSSPEALPKEALKGSKAQYQVGGPLFDYAAKGNKVELIGRDSVNGVSAYKIKLTTADSITNIFYIDPTTYYILKVDIKANVGGQDVETSIAYSNYQKTDFGYVIPMTEQITLPQGITLNITHKKIDINKDIDPKVFEMPKS